MSRISWIHELAGGRVEAVGGLVRKCTWDSGR